DRRGDRAARDQGEIPPYRFRADGPRREGVLRTARLGNKAMGRLPHRDRPAEMIATLIDSPPSWPGLSRPSTSLGYRKKGVDGRHKAGHDESWAIAIAEGPLSLRLPGNRLALDLGKEERGDQPKDADRDDAHEHHVDLEELPRIPDQIADAAL